MARTTPTIPDSWRPTRDSGPGRRVRRFGLRALVTLGTLLLLVLFGWFVFQPFWHANTQAVVLSGADYGPLNAPYLSFVDEDFGGFTPMREALTPRGSQSDTPLHLAALRDPASLEQLADYLRENRARARDVQIFYGAAHGVAVSGEGLLLCGNLGASELTDGSCPVQDLLQQIGRSPAKVKLLLLDSGRLASDVRAGLLLNEFPNALETAVHTSQDPTLWVIASNSSMERSHISQALQQSLFGYFITQGLRGAADLNQDNLIDLGELYRFVTTNVGSWVQQSSGGSATQTPQLLWGGGDWGDVEPPVLLSVARLPNRVRRVDHVASIRTAQENAEIIGYVAGVRVATPGQVAGQAVHRVVPQSGIAGRLASVGRDASSASNDSTQPTPGVGDEVSTNGQNAQADADDSGDKAASDDGTAEPSGAAPQDAATKEKEAAPDPTPGLLAQAWQAIDELNSEKAFAQRPVNFAPDYWRRFQELLLWQEQAYRGGSRGSIAADLARELLPLPLLLRGESPGPRSKLGLADAIAQLAPQPQVTADRIGSVSLAQSLIDAKDAAPSVALQPLSQAMEALFAIDEPDKMETWLREQWKPEYDEFYELRLAKQLAGPWGPSWPTWKLALRTRYEAERTAAAALGATAWVSQLCESADRERLYGEQLLLDRLAADYEGRASEHLEQALRSYQSAAQQLALVQAARQLHNEQLHCLPYYAAWWQAANDVAAAGSPQYDTLRQLVESLGKLSDVLGHPAAHTLADLRRVHVELLDLRAEVETGLQSKNVNALVQLPHQPGDAWRMESLLTTPLLAANLRLPLLAAATPADTALSERFVLPSVPRTVIGSRMPSTRDWESVGQWAKLEAEIARLAGSGVEELDSAFAPIGQAVDALQAAREAMQSDAADKTGEGPRPEYRRLGQTLHDFYGELPDRISRVVIKHSDLSTQADRSDSLEAIWAADRALRLMDARDAGRLRDARPTPLLRRAALYDHLAWCRRRLLLARDDASPTEVGYLLDKADDLRQLAMSVPGQPAFGPPLPAAAELRAASSLALTMEAAQKIIVEVHGIRSGQNRVWLILDYDPTLLEVDAPAELSIFREPALRDQWSESAPLATGDAKAQQPDLPTNGAGEPAAKTPDAGAPAHESSAQKLARVERRLRLNLSGMQPSVDLRGSELRRVPLAVRRIAPSATPSRLVVKAVTSNSCVRQEINIYLPQPESFRLNVQGVAGSWTSEKTGAILHPFPNRLTEYELGISNTLDATETVSVDMFALQVPLPVAPPPSELTLADADQWLQQVVKPKNVRHIEKLTLPGDGSPVPLIAKPEQANGASGGAAPESDQPPPEPARHGLLLVVRDTESGRTAIKYIGISVQRPRRYVRPRVAYDRRQQRIAIRVQPLDRSLLPPDGVKVRCEFSGDTTEDMEAKREGVLGGPDYETLLYAIVPDKPGRMVQVALTVDDYPRAFLYNVPCNTSTGELPEDVNRLDARLTAPAAGTVFPKSTETVPAVLQINAPLGAFQNGGDFVEVGIDGDRDRDFREESPLRLDLDRDVHVAIATFGEQGQIVLKAEVSDFQVDLPCRAWRNVPVNVIARVVVDGRVAWSLPREVLVDESPPKITRIELDPSPAVAGSPLAVSSWSTDNDPRGVAKILVAFDVARQGQFSEDAPPVEAELVGATRWVAELPTDAVSPGPYTVLAQAVDHAGNVGSYSRAKVRIITAAEASDMASNQRRRLTGDVLYYNSPRSDAKVTLAEVDADSAGGEPKELGEVQTDERGVFVFPAVPPGKYVLTARAVVRNKPRRADVDIEVPAEPDQVQPVTVELK